MIESPSVSQNQFPKVETKSPALKNRVLPSPHKIEKILRLKTNSTVSKKLFPTKWRYKIKIYFWYKSIIKSLINQTIEELSFAYWTLPLSINFPYWLFSLFFYLFFITKNPTNPITRITPKTISKVYHHFQLI